MFPLKCIFFFNWGSKMLLWHTDEPSSHGSIGHLLTGTRAKPRCHWGARADPAHWLMQNLARYNCLFFFLIAVSKKMFGSLTHAVQGRLSSHSHPLSLPEGFHSFFAAYMRPGTAEIHFTSPPPFADALSLPCWHKKEEKRTKSGEKF